MMRALAAFGVRNPVVSNLIAFSLIAAGLVFGVTLRREFFPEVRPNMVVIVAPYPGASPAEIEVSLAQKIEDAIDDLPEIKEINTTVTDGSASLRIELHEGEDVDTAVAEVKRRMDALQDLPEQAERIVVDTFEPNLPVISLNLVGDADEAVMKRAIRQIRDDLRSLPGMGDLVISGVRNDELLVECDPDQLLQHGVSVTAVADRVREAMSEVPAGAVRSATANVTIRSVPVEERAEEVRNIVVRTAPDGTLVRLSDIADVRRGFRDVDLRTRLNGKPAVTVTPFKVADEDAVEIAEMVKAYAAGRRGEPLELTPLERLKSVLRPRGGGPASSREAAWDVGRSRTTPPPGELVLTTDLARFITGRLDLLMRNALWGGVLVLATLVLLLNIRVAMWVTAGLVVSILGTLAFMHFAGITLNLLTMFGLIIVLGLLVDDAIVVAENITSRHEAGEPPEHAAINGTSIVAWPVVATVITTVLAFGALALVEGQIGDMLVVLPKVVMVALGVSLIEALLILPQHMRHSLHKADLAKANGRGSRLMSRVDERRAHIIRRVIVPRYLRFLRVALSHRYLTVAAAVAVLIVSIGMVAGGRVAFTFLGTQDAETLVADLRMPIGTPASQTDLVVRQLETAARAQPEVVYVVAVVGARSDPEGQSTIEQPHIAQLWIELTTGEQRDRTSDQVRDAIRQEAGELAGIKSLTMDAIQGGPGGPPLTYTVTGSSAGRIAPVVDEVKRLLSGLSGVYDVADDADAGQHELRIELRPGARDLGITNQSLATQVRGWIYGLEPYTFAAPDEDVDVRVTLGEPYRRSLAAIERLHIITADGRAIPLPEVARLEETLAYATVRRLDGRRAVTVTAQVYEQVSNPEQIAAQIAPELRSIERANAGVRILARGRQKEVMESLSTLPLGLAVACSLIYVCLAWLFGSYTQPLVVLTSVPFGAVGMIWGHLIMGYDLTMLSLIGFIALSGVVVNDSLIFIEFYNIKRREGIERFDAAIEAGRSRFRAILLTTLTTVLGLSPLMLETSFQAKFLIPMAITISFGLIAATGIVLLVLPCLLLIGADMRTAIKTAWTGRRPAPEAARVM